MVRIVILAPFLAFMTQGMREIQRQHEVFQAKHRAFLAKMIASHTDIERQELAQAHEQAELAAECRAKDARGEPPEGMSTWADKARFHEEQTAWWRGRAAWSSSMRKQMEQMENSSR